MAERLKPVLHLGQRVAHLSEGCCWIDTGALLATFVVDIDGCGDICGSVGCGGEYS